MSYITNREERVAALEALTTLRDNIEFLERGLFLCIALNSLDQENKITRYAWYSAKALIHRSLGHHATLIDWMTPNNPTFCFRNISVEEGLAHRKRWLHALIQALEESLKGKG